MGAIKLGLEAFYLRLHGSVRRCIRIVLPASSFECVHTQRNSRVYLRAAKISNFCAEGGSVGSCCGMAILPSRVLEPRKDALDTDAKEYCMQNTSMPPVTGVDGLALASIR